MRYGTLFLAVLVLAGCKTTEQRIAEDDAKCKSYGLNVGTPPYVECRMNLDQHRAATKSAENLAGAGGLVGLLIRSSGE